MDKQQQMMNLWRQNFQDTEEFIRFYFARKYSDENALVYQENGKPLSGLLMLPYPTSWAGTMLKTSYISGACTQQEARNRGLMTLLLKNAFAEMHKRNVALSTLIPAEDWLYDYYGKLGYADVYKYTLLEECVTDFSSPADIKGFSPEKYEREFTNEVYAYFDKRTKQRSCCIQHSREDYECIVEEAYLSGGRLAATWRKSSGEVTGWALAFPEDGQIKVKEIFYDTPEDKEMLYRSFARTWKLNKVECRIPPHPQNFYRYGMARIINVQQMLQYIADLRPQLSLSLQVNDPQLPANQGIYILSKGNCKKEASRQIDVVTHITDLTRALLGDHSGQFPQALAVLSTHEQPYMNLMLD